MLWPFATSKTGETGDGTYRRRYQVLSVCGKDDDQDQLTRIVPKCMCEGVCVFEETLGVCVIWLAPQITIVADRVGR